MLEEQRDADELLFFLQKNDEQHTRDNTEKEKTNTQKCFGGGTNPRFLLGYIPTDK